MFYCTPPCFFSCRIFVAKCSFLGSFCIPLPKCHLSVKQSVCAAGHLPSCIFCWKGLNFCRCCFLLFTVGVVSRSFWHPLRVMLIPFFFFVYSKQSALIWRLHFTARNHWQLINWLTLIAAPDSFFICRDFSFYWQVWGDSRLWWEVMMWKAVLEEGGEDERGPWQLSHSNKRLPLWTDTQRRGVGWGEPPSPHSCHRPVSQDVIVPPHLDWTDNGLLVSVGIRQTSPQRLLDTTHNSGETAFRSCLVIFCSV